MAGAPASHSPDAKLIGITEALVMLSEAALVIGHNHIGYDIPVLHKLFPGWPGVQQDRVFDTMIAARLVRPSEQIKDTDFRLNKAGRFPGNMIGSFSLEAFGYRIGILKGVYDGGWEAWNPAMQEYCEQDVHVTEALYRLLQAELDAWGNPIALRLEHDVAWIIERQTRFGFGFDREAAAKLYAKLVAERTELEATLAIVFPPETVETVFVPKANNSKLGYVKGVPFIKRVIVPFDPSSRRMVADRLTKKYGWEPDEFNKDGTPALDNDTLDALPYPEAKLLSHFYQLQKIMGYIGEGRNAWLRLEKNGRLHGRVTTNGAVTGRMTHSLPNLAQVPKVGKLYGKECRSLFRNTLGTLVGCDADALELRCLAAFLRRYDGGAFIATVLEGKKENGTDMHTLNALALGLDPKAPVLGDLTGRDVVKAWFYALIYGAGDFKLGYTITGLKTPRDAIARRGKKDRTTYLSRLSGMGKLVEALQKAIKKRPYLIGIDGRRIFVRSSHSVLNTLLQSAGAVLMKMGLVIADKELQARGLVPGVDYEFAINVHDEWQVDCLPSQVDVLKEVLPWAIEEAGIVLKFLCPLKGNADVGQTWADTH